jgi:hypothetical protein
MTTDATDLRLDGNAAAGPLAELFRFEMTLAWTTCAGCGAANPIGALMDYGGEMGVILRCPGCDTAILRFAHSAGRYWLDLRGAACLRIEPTA